MILGKTRVCAVMILFVAFTLPAADSDIVLRAQNDAAEDARDYHAFWWSIAGVATTVVPVLMAAFCADAIPVDARRAIAVTTPVAAGSGLALIGFCTGKAVMPASRRAEIQDAYGDSSQVSLYESEYVKTLTKLQRRKQGGCALLGSGVSIGAGVLGFLIVYLAK
jgi:hypothetical protein